MAFVPFTARDFVALVIVACDALRGVGVTSNGSASRDRVARAFAIADEFVEQSESHWAESARRDHRKRVARKS